MFGWFGRSGRKKKAVEALASGTSDARTILTGLPEDEREAVFQAASRQLLFDGQPAKAAHLASVALELGPETVNALVIADDVFAEYGNLERCVAICERLVELTDEAEPHVVRLARRLISVDKADDALEVLEVTSAASVDAALARAEAFVALERNSEALPILREIVDHDLRRMKNAFDGVDYAQVKDRFEHAQQLHDSVLAEVEGAEQVIVAAMRAGRIDPRSAVNFRLLAESLMVESTYVPQETSLRAPADTIRLGFDERDAWSVARFASAKLRLGELKDARRLFERARDADGRCFAAYRGLAGTGAAERTRPFERGHGLKVHPAPEGIERVVLDWPNLTETETRIVIASVAPLRAFLKPLAAAKARVALLPIDVRVGDLPAFEDGVGTRFDDHRAFEALGGVASSVSGLAASRIEDLLGYGGEHGLVFAHEFAHLAYFCLPEANPFREFYEWAKNTPHVATSYELSNEDEFFAGAYEAYLRRAWDLPSRGVADDVGVYDEVFACFDEIARL